MRESDLSGFDWIEVRTALPGQPPAFAGLAGYLFQTHDLDQKADLYAITEHGWLTKIADQSGPLIPVTMGFTGTILLHASNMKGVAGEQIYTLAGEDAETVTYRATFVSGLLTCLRERGRTRSPASPLAELFASVGDLR